MNLNLSTPINQLGYGIVGLNVLNSLANLGHEVALFPIGNIDIPNESLFLYQENVKNALDRSKYFSYNSPSLRIWHQYDMAQSVGRGLRVGMPIFELDKFTEQEIHHIDSLDLILVNSEWAQDIVWEQLNLNYKCAEVTMFDKVKVVPLGVDPDIFFPLPNNRKTTVFLNIGKWEVRKGHDILYQAFNKAFKETDDVELWMCCTNPFYSKEMNESWENLYLHSKLGSKIKIIPRLNTQKDIAYLMKQADCGVFPSRGEGWNLEALEMMACGKKIIITDYSAHTEFCNKENSYLIPISKTEPAHDGIWFKGQGNWAHLGQEQIFELIECMRHVHQFKSLGEDITNYEGIKTSYQFSWKNTAQKIVESLNG